MRVEQMLNNRRIDTVENCSARAFLCKFEQTFMLCGIWRIMFSSEILFFVNFLLSKSFFVNVLVVFKNDFVDIKRKSWLLMVVVFPPKGE